MNWTKVHEGPSCKFSLLLHIKPLTSIKTLSFISWYPRGLSCGPVAPRRPQTDNRELLVLIQLWGRLSVCFLLWPPQEGSEGLLLLHGALWVFLYEFLSWTMGQCSGPRPLLISETIRGGGISPTATSLWSKPDEENMCACCVGVYITHL